MSAVKFEIPPRANSVEGVVEPNIDLNSNCWEFLFEPPEGVPNPEEKNQDFDFCAWSDKDWKTVKVPGGLVMQGFDIKNNTEYYYKRQIDIPSDYAGNRIIIRFDGVYTYARIWVNGHYIRTHKGGFTTWDCDITDCVEAGQTVVLTVGVADIEGTTKGTWNQSGEYIWEPSYASGYAHHNIGGILRDVTLITLPKDYISAIYAQTTFDDSYTDSKLRIAASLGMVSENALLEFEVFKKGGGPLIASGNIGFTKSESNTGEIVIDVENPDKWEAEHPNLYTLRVKLKVGGTTKQVVEQNLGFREIVFGGVGGTELNKLYVNGKSVNMRGTCRHDMSYNLGRCNDREQIYREMRNYKACNINLVRTSHYPAQEDLLDACDELGLYVEQENAVVWQGHIGRISPSGTIISAQKEIIERDKNRPCILFWSIGNESGFYSNPEFQEALDYAKSADRRPVFLSDNYFHEDKGTYEESYHGVFSKHYGSWDAPLSIKDIPVFLDEYISNSYEHSFRDHTKDWNVLNFWSVGLYKYWENIYKTDGNIGGANWAATDDVFFIPKSATVFWDTKLTPGMGTGYGPWGTVHDTYMRLKPEAYGTKKAYSPIRLDESKVGVSGSILNLPVANWFDHTNFNELKIEYSTDGGKIKTIEPSDMPDIAPHSDGIIKIEGLWDDVKTVNIKFYTTYDGILIDEYNVKPTNWRYAFIRKKDAKVPTFAEDLDTITVLGEDFSVIFDKKVGLIKKAEHKGELLIGGGPHLHLPDIGLGKWIPAETGGVAAVLSDNKAMVKISGKYENGYEAEFTLTISGDGHIVTDYVLISVPEESDGLSEVGLSYDISGDIESVNWIRNGFHSAYPDYHTARNSGKALKVRENAAVKPDIYGVKPEWNWKDDMKDFFLYAPDDPNNGIATKDFNTMRENIWLYEVNFNKTASKLSVESENADSAARVELFKTMGENTSKLIINKQWFYRSIPWGNYPGTPGKLQSGLRGFVTIRLTDTDNITVIQ